MLYLPSLLRNLDDSVLKASTWCKSDSATCQASHIIANIHQYVLLRKEALMLPAAVWCVPERRALCLFATVDINEDRRIAPDMPRHVP